MPTPPPTSGGQAAQELRKADDAADRPAADGKSSGWGLEKQMDLRLGAQSVASASQLGDYFQYLIDKPVNLARQKSAL